MARPKKKENKKLADIKQLTRLNKTFKSNKRLFHQKINNILHEKTDTTIDLDTARNEIFKLFNECDTKNEQLERISQNEIDEYGRLHFNKIYNFKIDENKLVNIINKLPNNKAVGYNKISNEMIKYGISPQLIKLIKLMFETIKNNDVMPKNFNKGLVKMLVKDEKKIRMT